MDHLHHRVEFGYMTTPSYKGCWEMPSKQPCAQVQAPLLYKREKQVYEGNSAFFLPPVGEKPPQLNIYVRQENVALNVLLLIGPDSHAL